MHQVHELVNQAHDPEQRRQPIHEGRNDVLFLFLAILNLLPEQFLLGNAKRRCRFALPNTSTRDAFNVSC